MIINYDNVSVVEYLIKLTRGVKQMSESSPRYYIEPIGNNTNINVVDLLGGDSSEKISLRVRGKPRKVFEIPDLDIKKVISSQDHRDNVRIYSQRGDEEPKLVYPKRRL